MPNSFDDRVADMLRRRRDSRMPAVPKSTVLDFMRNQRKGVAPIRFEPKRIKAPKVKKRSNRYPFLEVEV